MNGMIWFMNISTGISSNKVEVVLILRNSMLESQRQHTPSPCCRTHLTWYPIETCKCSFYKLGRQYKSTTFIRASSEIDMYCCNIICHRITMFSCNRANQYLRRRSVSRSEQSRQHAPPARPVDEVSGE
jgi:hypothetical protein